MLSLTGESFWGGFCGIIGATDATLGAVKYFAAATVINPVLGGVLVVTSLGCAAYGLSQL